ncbi:uncharacterized protein DUF2512 [Melghirimyces profundicolus]|uniref:Uncharacterized protein DUF2512 n=1 Tax=Melghirimyces profundicolus TaxID=1242148 RepID=A0A2T6C4V5_9BACL|nr:hypothetical protein [Melghirimyces profundicolus]PTX63317.1 uncharacterized protein DUF2512 [Melghirimyces profundicolus]
MAGLIVKLLIYPSVLLVSDWFFADLYYPSVFHPLITGVVLALAAHFMEVAMLRPGNFWASNLTDFAAAAVIIYLSARILPGARVTLIGALLTAFFLAVTEYFQHLWLLRSGKTEKAV